MSDFFQWPTWDEFVADAQLRAKQVVIGLAPGGVLSSDPNTGVQMQTSWWDKAVNITTGKLTTNELNVASQGVPEAIRDYKAQHGDPVPSSVGELISLSDVFGSGGGAGSSAGIGTLLVIGGVFGLLLYTFSGKGRR